MFLACIAIVFGFLRKLKGNKKAMCWKSKVWLVDSPAAPPAEWIKLGSTWILATIDETVRIAAFLRYSD